MNQPPLWINGKLRCQYPVDGQPCGREMFVRGNRAVCEIAWHGRVFTVPDRRCNAPDPAREWKDSLPIARVRFRKDIRNNGPRHSVGVWRVNGDPEHAWTPALFDVGPGDASLTEQGTPLVDGCIVARFRVTGKAYRTVLLKPFEISEWDREHRHWEVD